VIFGTTFGVGNTVGLQDVVGAGKVGLQDVPVGACSMCIRGDRQADKLTVSNIDQPPALWPGLVKPQIIREMVV
jgi:hypothetical protein